MAKSNAERQRAYRAARKFAGDNGERTIHAVVTTGAALALDRLARRHGVTKRAMLEKLILEADSAIMETLDYGSAELNAYLRG